MAVFPTGTSTDADLYIGVNNLSTVLTDNPLTAGATTVNVSSTTGFPTVGIITIDLEAIEYTGTTATSFTGCTRGFDGTTAASHPVSTTVFHDIPAAHHNVLKDEVIAIETYLKDVLDETADGTALLPAYSFASSPSTGLYSFAANACAITTNGVLRTSWDAAGLATFNYGLDMGNSSTLKITDGAVATPGMSFASDTDLGFYREGANHMSVSAGNNRVLSFLNTENVNFVDLRFQGSGILKGLDGSSAAPFFTFSADTNTGMYRIAADRLGFSAGGTVGIDIDTTRVEIFNMPIHTGAGTAAAPSYSFSLDNDTGAYNSTTNAYSIATNGVETVRFDANATAANTRMLIYDVDNGTLERVSVGAADSGGAGFKVLRIPN